MCPPPREGLCQTHFINTKRALKEVWGHGFCRFKPEYDRILCNVRQMWVSSAFVGISFGSGLAGEHAPRRRGPKSASCMCKTHVAQCPTPVPKLCIPEMGPDIFHSGCSTPPPHPTLGSGKLPYKTGSGGVRPLNVREVGEDVSPAEYGFTALDVPLGHLPEWCQCCVMLHILCPREPFWLKMRYPHLPVAKLHAQMAGTNTMTPERPCKKRKASKSPLQELDGNSELADDDMAEDASIHLSVLAIANIVRHEIQARLSPVESRLNTTQSMFESRMDGVESMLHDHKDGIAKMERAMGSPGIHARSGATEASMAIKKQLAELQNQIDNLRIQRVQSPPDTSRIMVVGGLHSLSDMTDILLSMRGPMIAGTSTSSRDFKSHLFVKPLRAR